MQEGLQAIEAAKRLSAILSENVFRIEPSGRKDRYGRELARVMIGEVSVGLMLVQEGLARPWSRKSEDWCPW